MKSLIPKILKYWVSALALSFALMPSPLHAAFGFKLDGTLDKSVISKFYFEGEFQRILAPLEAFRASHAHKNREDSIFVYKHLSVIYAADSTTRNKGESYMFQLLKLMPTVELMDMYVSDNIEAIFKNVQEKFQKQQQYLREHDPNAIPHQNSARGVAGAIPTVVTPKSDRSKTWFWLSAAGVGAMAAVGAVYFAVDADKPVRAAFNPKL